MEPQGRPAWAWPNKRSVRSGVMDTSGRSAAILHSGFGPLGLTVEVVDHAERRTRSALELDPRKGHRSLNSRVKVLALGAHQPVESTRRRRRPRSHRRSTRDRVDGIHEWGPRRGQVRRHAGPAYRAGVHPFDLPSASRRAAASGLMSPGSLGRPASDVPLHGSPSCSARRIRGTPPSGRMMTAATAARTPAEVWRPRRSSKPRCVQSTSSEDNRSPSGYHAKNQGDRESSRPQL